MSITGTPSANEDSSVALVHETSLRPADSRLAVGYVVSRWGAPTQTFVRREAFAVRDLGADISVFSLKEPFPVETQDAVWLVRSQVIRGFVSGLRAKPMKTISLLWGVRKAIPRNRPAMLGATIIGIGWSGSGRVDRHLHSHFGWVSGAAARAAAIHAGGTYSVVYHAFEIHSDGKLDLFAASVACDALQVFVIAERDVATIENALGVRPAVTRMGVPIEWTRSPVIARSGGRQIVSVGSLSEKKGHRYLIEAMASTPEWTLTIVGEGPLRAELEQLVARHGLSDRVQLVGGKTESEVRAMLRSADVFALACVEAGNGDRDGIPVALMEAMAVGLPVVTTDLGGIPELVEDVGYLVEQRSSRAIGCALNELTDADVRTRVGALGRQRIIDSWTVEHLAAELLDGRLRRAVSAGVERKRLA